jgi:hypothetical protein
MAETTVTYKSDSIAITIEKPWLWRTKSWAKWKLKKCLDCEFNNHNDTSKRFFKYSQIICRKCDKLISKVTKKDCQGTSKHKESCKKADEQTGVFPNKETEKNEFWRYCVTCGNKISLITKSCGGRDGGW